MSDQNGSAGAIPPPAVVPAHPAFPVVRLLFALGFVFLAWCVFWTILILALVQFIVVGVNGRVHDELKQFSHSLILYLGEMLGYATFAKDEQPFPFGPFPKTPVS